jgi:methylglyoxal synthase
MISKMHIAKRIAIVAQENKKNELIEWSFHNRHILSKHEIIAAGYAGDVLEGTLNTPVNKLTAGAPGGYEEVAKLITKAEVDMIIFLWDAEQTQPNENPIKTLFRLAEKQNIAIACNMRSGEVMLHSTFLNEYREGKTASFATKAAV